MMWDDNINSSAETTTEEWCQRILLGFQLCKESIYRKLSVSSKLSLKWGILLSNQEAAFGIDNQNLLGWKEQCWISNYADTRVYKYITFPKFPTLTTVVLIDHTYLKLPCLVPITIEIYGSCCPEQVSTQADRKFKLNWYLSGILKTEKF